MVAVERQEDHRSTSPLPAWLSTAPTISVNPPVVTREQELPFAETGPWKNLERLCLRSAGEARVEHCQLYGVPGQMQDGIDLFARESFNSKYRVYQCKNEARFSASKSLTLSMNSLRGAGRIQRIRSFSALARAWNRPIVQKSSMHKLSACEIAESS